MFEELKKDILAYRVKRKCLVYVGGERMAFKTTLSSSKWFAETELGHEIMSATSYLPAECGIPFRLKCIFSGVSCTPKCPICGKDCVPLTQSLSVKNECFSKMCSDPVCRAKYSASFIVMTDEIRSSHAAAQTRHKDRVRLKYKRLMRLYNERAFNSLGRNAVIKFYDERVSARRLNGKLVREKDFDHNVDILCSILMLTSDIIPIDVDADSDSIDMSEFRFNERMYCISKGLSEKPLCKYCRENRVKFNNIVDGYAESCPDCQADKCREKKGLKTKAQIIADIDHAKYEIISFPKRVGIDKLVIKCQKCGYVSSWKSGCGMLQTLRNKKLCKNCEIFDSASEREMADYVMSICGGDVLRNDRQHIAPQELDVVVPVAKTAIEFDGFYYHSDNRVKPGYHSFKTHRCEAVGLRLVHVFENEWAFRRDAVKSEIRYALGLSGQKLTGHSLALREIERTDYTEFFRSNSMGFDLTPSNCSFYGMFDGDIMVASVAMSSRLRRCYDIYCVSVLDGYERDVISERVVSELVSLVKPNSVRVFTDRRLAEPMYLHNMGFKRSYSTKIRGWWHASGNFRHEFEMKLDDGSAETESAMRSAGYRRIFDCGSAVFRRDFRAGGK